RSMATPTSVSLKLLVDKKGHRVLFAEANKDFVDFLFYILSLPIATVIRLLTKDGMVGCLGNLYDSIQHLNETYMQPDYQKKDNILKPKVPNSDVKVPLLLPNVESSTSKKLYKCPNHHRSNNSVYGDFRLTDCHKYVADDPNARCPHCNNVMSSQASYVAPPDVNRATSSQEGGFVKGVVTYMIMDDLVVKPMSSISSITMLNNFNIKEVGLLEEKVINIDMDKV
ncbi:DUF674 domain-containing protein, partial [Cephalotus follicularis]